MPAADGEPGARPRRLRIRYAKTGKIRFTGHRDVVRMWERAARRSGLPVAWSEGFSPRPLLSFGLALPTGAESLAEYLDATLAEPLAPETGDADPGPGPTLEGDRPQLAVHLGALLPDGIDVQIVRDLPEGTGSLQQEVSSCSWELEVLGLAVEELATRVERLLVAPRVLVSRERKGRTVRDDLRPGILDLVALPSTPGAGGAPTGEHSRALLRAELATRPRGVRPRELLDGLGPGVGLAWARRNHQWIERDGARWEPLAEDAGLPRTGVPHAEERAS